MMSYTYGGCPMRPNCDCDQNICRQSVAAPVSPFEFALSDGDIVDRPCYDQYGSTIPCAAMFEFDCGPRVETFAGRIYDAYAEMNDFDSRWAGDKLTDATRAKFRKIADDALDVIEWRSFALAPMEAGS